jgi:hypothetical protein
MAFSLTKDSTLTVKARCTRKAAVRTELKPDDAELNSIGRLWTLHEKPSRFFYSLRVMRSSLWGTSMPSKCTVQMVTLAIVCPARKGRHSFSILWTNEGNKGEATPGRSTRKKSWVASGSKAGIARGPRLVRIRDIRLRTTAPPRNGRWYPEPQKGAKRNGCSGPAQPQKTLRRPCRRCLLPAARECPAGALSTRLVGSL